MTWCGVKNSSIHGARKLRRNIKVFRVEACINRIHFTVNTPKLLILLVHLNKLPQGTFVFVVFENLNDVVGRYILNLKSHINSSWNLIKRNS